MLAIVSESSTSLPVRSPRVVPSASTNKAETAIFKAGLRRNLAISSSAGPAASDIDLQVFNSRITEKKLESISASRTCGRKDGAEPAY